VKLRVPSKAGIKRRAATTTDKTLRVLARSQARRRLGKSLPEHAKVQLGCGEHHFDGWVNVDINSAVHPDVRLDLRAGFPAPQESVALFFSEHVFEHLTLDDGRQVFADCCAALERGGVMRIAMPDLRYLVERYIEGRYEGEGGPEAQLDVDYRRIDSPALLFNFALRSWGHLYLYDFAELDLRLRQAGFAKVDPQQIGVSTHPELVGLEQRGESRLIVEATK
jgi:predicted SAM-dependent methyltransferase